jgi:hypothetical protein
MQINNINTTNIVNNGIKTAEKVINTTKNITQNKKVNIALASAAISGMYIAYKASKKPLERNIELENRMKQLTNSPEEFRRAMRLASLKFEEKDIKTIINDEKLFDRAIELKNLGLDTKTIKKYINMSDNEFYNYINLAKSGILSKGSEQLDSIKNEEYLKFQLKPENLKKIICYTKLGISNEDLYPFIKMDKVERNEILKYMQKGSGYEKAKEILKSPKKDEINSYIEQGISPSIALKLANLTENKKNKFFTMLEKGTNQLIAFRTAIFSGAKEKVFNDMLSLGIEPHIASDIANVDLVSKSKILNPQIANDINILLKNELYKKENVKYEDIFVKKYTSKQEALKELKTGETCRIGDSEKVNIKRSDGNLEELNLSAKKYMELFPPVTRFAISQGQIGDCFLISTLDNAFKNPKTRVYILRCFNEQANGDITVKYPKSDITFTVQNGKKFNDYLPETFNDFSTVEKNGKTAIVSGSDGIRMLEYLYGKVSQDLDIKHFNSRIDSTWEKIRNATEDYQFDNLHDDLMKYFMIRKLNVLSPEQSRIGGYAYQVMDTLGLNKTEMYSGNIEETRKYNAKDGKHGNLVIKSSFDKGLEKIKKQNSNLLILAGTKPLKKNPRGLVGSHAYELEVIKNDNGTHSFRVTNPHNSTSSIDLTEKEFKEYFAKIYTGEIGD